MYRSNVSVSEYGEFYGLAPTSKVTNKLFSTPSIPHSWGEKEGIGGHPQTLGKGAWPLCTPLGAFLQERFANRPYEKRQAPAGGILHLFSSVMESTPPYEGRRGHLGVLGGFCRLSLTSSHHCLASSFLVKTAMWDILHLWAPLQFAQYLRYLAGRRPRQRGALLDGLGPLRAKVVIDHIVHVKPVDTGDL